MNNKTQVKILSFVKIILAVAAILLLSVNCTDKETKDLIPEKSFSSIISEIYLANGLIIVPEVRESFSGLDSARIYYDIIESHGFTKEQMENTLRYYFFKNPKKMIRIYNQAIDDMHEKEILFQAEMSLKTARESSLWKDNPDYYLPDTIINRKLRFDYQLRNPGFYTLEFRATVYPDDQSSNPRFRALTYHGDSVGTGKVNYLPEIKYIKDGLPHIYRTSFRVQFKNPVYLELYLFEHDNKPGLGIPRASFKDISILFTPSS